MTAPDSEPYGERRSPSERRDIESRLSRVESDVSNLNHLIRAVAPLVGDFRELSVEQRNLTKAVDELKLEWRDDVRHFDAEIEKISAGQDRDQRDSRNFRRMIYGIGLAAILSPIGTLTVALLQSQ